MGIFKDTYYFSLNDVTFTVEVGPSKVTSSDMHAVVIKNEEILAKDSIDDIFEDDRKLYLSFTDDAQHNIKVEVGAIDLLRNTAVVVCLDEKLIYESHPGEKVISWSDLVSKQAGLYADGDESSDDQANNSSTSSILDERDKTFDQLDAKRKGFTGVFLTAIVLVALWVLFTDAAGIDIIIVTSAVLISGLAAQLLLRIPTISGGALAIATGLVLYGAAHEYILNNEPATRIGLTLTSIAIVAGYSVYYTYYRLNSNKNDPSSKLARIPFSDIRRSVSLFLFLAITNAVFTVYASDAIFYLWNFVALTLIITSVFSPLIKKRTPIQRYKAKSSTVSKSKTEKPKVKKKHNSKDL